MRKEEFPITITLQLSKDVHEDIILWEQDNINQVANRFCAKYSLPAEIREQIVLEFQRQLTEACGQTGARQGSEKPDRESQLDNASNQAGDIYLGSQVSKQAPKLNQKNPYIEPINSPEENQRQLVESTPLKEISKSW